MDAGVETLNSAIALIDDTNKDLRHYSEQVIVDPQTLADTEARLEQIYGLARKHRVQPERLAEHAQSLRKEFDAIASDRSSLEQLTAQEAEQQRAFKEQAKELSSLRTKSKVVWICSGRTDARAGHEGRRAQHRISSPTKRTRVEQIEFHVRTNKSFDAGPLNRIASGGEQPHQSCYSDCCCSAKPAAMPDFG